MPQALVRSGGHQCELQGSAGNSEAADDNEGTTPGESVFIETFSGPLTFATGGGIQLGGKTVAQFVRLDILNAWAMVGIAPANWSHG